MDDSAEQTIVGHDEWLEARRTLLLKEKEFAGQLHEGEKTHVHISLVAQRVILLAAEVTIGATVPAVYRAPFPFFDDFFSSPSTCARRARSFL